MDADTQPPDHDHRYVVNRLIHIYQEAERQAQLVMDHLKANGYQPQRHTDSSPLSNESTARARTFLLELGAGLRNASLHGNGAARFFPTKLPSPNDGMQQAYKSVEPAAQASLHDKMFRTTTKYLLPGARSALGVDVVKPEVPASINQTLNRFAMFLWEHRGLTD